MPFWPGAHLNVRFEGDPNTAVLEFCGRSYTVANDGLHVQTDGGLICDPLVLPNEPGEWPYFFHDANGAEERGMWRTVDAPGERPPMAVNEPPPGLQG